MKAVLLFLLFIISSQLTNAQHDKLNQSFQAQVGTEIFHFEFKEKNAYLYHGMNPWDVGMSIKNGKVWANKTQFYKSDTIKRNNGEDLHSKIEYDSEKLLSIKYRKNNISEVSQSELDAFLVNTLKYTPNLMLNYFNAHKDRVTQNANNENGFTTQLKEYQVELFVDEKTNLVSKISTFSSIESDDQYYGFGDVTDVYYYENYELVEGKTYHPQEVILSELNGKLKDTVEIQSLQIADHLIDLIPDPKLFEIQEDEIVKPDITIEHYSENVYFINLHHCGTRSLMVEFEDFVLVAESPLNSANGEILIAEVKKLAPNKPIKYFVFGHFHPHYTGGVRPFISEGSKILCVEENQTYIQHIADAAHTLLPDALQKKPTEIKFEEIYQAKLITDGKFKMIIYHIGKKSHHTNDYMIYYFPKEKLVFQDDLLWFDENTTPDKVGDKMIGFHDAVKDLNLDVIEVAQNWSVFDKKNKMMFDFKQLSDLVEKAKLLK